MNSINLTLEETIALIDELADERRALAEQVKEMREALEKSAEEFAAVADHYLFGDNSSEAQEAVNRCDLAKHRIQYLLNLLEPTLAEHRATKNAEAASQVAAMAEQVKQMREALEAILDQENVTGLDIAIATKLVTSQPTAAEAQAKANAEKAAEYDRLVQEYGDPEGDDTLERVIKGFHGQMDYAFGEALKNAENAKEAGRLRLLMASATDLANSWAREIGVEESQQIEGLAKLIDRLWTRNSLQITENAEKAWLLDFLFNQWKENDIQLFTTHSGHYHYHVQGGLIYDGGAPIEALRAAKEGSDAS